MTIWYAIRTATRQEQRVIDALHDLAYARDIEVDAYLPCETRWNRLTRVKTIKHCPMLPGYLFVRLDAEHLWRVDQIEGVYQILGWNSRQTERESHRFGAFVEELRTAQTAGKFDHTNRQRHQGKRRHSLRPGQNVTINEGNFAGFVAQIVELSGAERIKVLLSIFGRETPVEIGAEEVSAQDSAPANAA